MSEEFTLTTGISIALTYVDNFVFVQILLGEGFVTFNGQSIAKVIPERNKISSSSHR